jgi:hypothetical protein
LLTAEKRERRRFISSGATGTERGATVSGGFFFLVRRASVGAEVF